ncbi:MAG TPA: fumarate reductase subunit C [Ramlibacter sp.]|uniref:fumarate reductase subunit C n=1 Tax=Ramlibacter sp. TaxID=1917967 RepID=UPI002C346240|nr:fumarate reductase subunit C [Ramlibacter sp.]HVZ43420.1 fumarate reductase subunit C [Ramlibacter sp.]
MNEPRVNGPYVRGMNRWWKRDPFFARYMARELTAFAVLAYSIVLAWGLVRLAQGEAAFGGWVAAVRSPLAMLLHAVILLSFIVHAKSWFEIMPKTMPMLFVGGRRVPARAVTRAGFVAAGVTSVAVLLLAVGWRAWN